MEMDIQKEKLLDHRKRLNKFTSDLFQMQIIKSNNDYLDEKHMEILNTIGKDYSFEESLIVKSTIDFLKNAK